MNKVVTVKQSIKFPLIAMHEKKKKLLLFEKPSCEELQVYNEETFLDHSGRCKKTTYIQLTLDQKY